MSITAISLILSDRKSVIIGTLELVLLIFLQYGTKYREFVYKIYTFLYKYDTRFDAPYVTHFENNLSLVMLEV